MAVKVAVADVVARYPAAAQLDPLYVQALIDDAIAELYEYIPDLDARIADGRIRQESVVKLVCKAVIGVLRNADGFKSESEGDYSYTRYGDGFVWFRQSDIDRLAPKRTTVETIHISLPSCGPR